MSLIEASALGVVVLAGVYLLALGAASLLAPARASGFLLGFASSRPVHFAEMAVRSVIGAALIIHAPRMLLPAAFSVFGWLLLVTTACLLLVPWQWHQRFARHAVPRAVRYITLIGVASLVFGGVILAAVALGAPPHF